MPRHLPERTFAPGWQMKVLIDRKWVDTAEDTEQYVRAVGA